MSNKLKNVSLQLFRKFLIYKGYKKIRTTGGHEIWSCKTSLRPVVLQTHVDPIPEFIVRNNLRSMSLTSTDFFEFLSSRN